MGAASLAMHAKRTTRIGGASWKLKKPYSDNAQGLIASAFPHLPFGEALLLELPPQAGGAWLTTLTTTIKHPITNAAGVATPSIALALTSSGLTAMGLDDDTLETFAPAFVEGMRQIDRQRRLGDAILDPASEVAVCSKETVIPEGPIWSGNAPERYPIPWENAAEPTPTTVHAALLLYEEDEAKLSELTHLAEAALSQSGIRIVRRIELSLKMEKDGCVHEHFGFADGISQPVPYGPSITPNDRDPRQGVAAGDFLFGHLTIDGDPAPGPIVRDTLPGAAALPTGKAPYGFRDLGLDGTYVVIRELRQDVKAFWVSMIEGARSHYRGHDKTWLAERVVGRTLAGVPLAPEGNGAHPRNSGHPTNDFGYFHKDRDGLGCPMGAHMRRANPRDGLAPSKEDVRDFLNASNNHRILRRGRKFGPVMDGLAWAERAVENPEAMQAAEAPDDQRGLLFMAINTDITRQFEFVQQTWVLNKSFAALSGEADPLVGPRGPFTVPEEPLRALPEVKTFVRLVGGDYFFLPSLAALNYLAQLP